MPQDPRFPRRPDHPDFWRLSKLAIAQDARVENAQDGVAMLRQMLAEIGDPASIDYTAENRVGLGLQKMGVAVSDRMEIIMRAVWTDAFRLGFAYAEQLAKERNDAGQE